MAEEALVARCYRCRRLVPVIMFHDGSSHIACAHCGNLSTARHPEWVPVSRLGVHFMTHSSQYITREDNNGGGRGVSLAAEAAALTPTTEEE